MQQLKKYCKWEKFTLKILINNLATFSLTLLSLYCHSQDNQFKAGLLAGGTLSQIHGDRIGGFNKLGINAGAFVTTSLTEKFNLGFEMYYIQKGSRMPPSKNNPFYWSIRLNYIEVPVLISYRYKDFAAEIGLSYGRLINQRFLDNGIEYTPPDFRIFNKNEFSGLVGLRYYWKENVSISARVTQSVWKTRDYSFTLPRYNFYNLNTGTLNYTINLSVYYQLPISKQNAKA